MKKQKCGRELSGPSSPANKSARLKPSYPFRNFMFSSVTFVKHLISSWFPVLLEAVPAIDGSCSIRLERNFRFLSAVRARYLVHFSGSIHTIFLLFRPSFGQSRMTVLVFKPAYLCPPMRRREALKPLYIQKPYTQCWKQRKGPVA